MTHTSFRSALASWLADQRKVDAPLVELRRIATGHSRAMWFVEMADGARFVARVEQGGVFGTSGSDEFALMQRAGKFGVPVAAARWNEPTGTVLGQPFFVMDYVEHLPTPREERGLDPEVAMDFIRQLNALHQARPSDGDGDLSTLDEQLSPNVTRGQVARWADVHRSTGIPNALLDEARAWLNLHTPTPVRVGIVHGDPGPGNFLHDGQRVVALTDWEFAHVGDPMEDWAYLIQMRGARTMSVDAWQALIDSTVGVRVTDDDLRYWTAFNLFKGACANLTCRAAFVGPNPAPNMAIIGTALHQVFLRRLVAITGNHHG